MPRFCTIALAVGSLLSILFIVWTLQVLSQGGIVELDREIALTMRDSAPGHHFRRSVMVAFTYAGSVPAMTIIAAAGAVWRWSAGDRKVAVAWVLIVAFGGLASIVFKTTFDRPRPPAEWRDEAVYENNESYPSGHSMGSVIGYGMLGYAVMQSLRGRVVRYLMPVLVAAMAGSIGFSRIYLRAHWFSDVVGGFIVGGAWLALGLGCLEWVHHRFVATR